jgi:hypothetical protein
MSLDFKYLKRKNIHSQARGKFKEGINITHVKKLHKAGIFNDINIIISWSNNLFVSFCLFNRERERDTFSFSKKIL